ncbi:phosphate ABC transporter substrate-binding/OmpA family protein [Litoreibacter roseus]|uniref:OmpA family protein n=1 Tax=Litoreibacter roseus TaxID=2601869 RepID=A0A6N6JES7_9RHOB|nr:phosphate ABC transporter substrate-binding/OmpA family protein [Litoreibacter roseus]GFE64447.1 OmpA family protein [Litoreibacter roseus]
MRNVLNFSSKPTLSVSALLGAALITLSANAGEVALKSADGTVNLVGEFIDFKDDNYIIRTALGDLRISASRVRCEGADCPKFETETADVRIAGSDTVGLGLMPLLMSGYASYLDAEASISNTAQEGVMLANFVGDGGFGDELGSFLVTSTSSGDAFKTLMGGTASIGMASRRIRPAEARELRDAGAGNMVSIDQEHIVAVDSLVMVVHPNNPVDTISIEQLQQIYSGQMTNWSELGGPDLPIKAISRQSNSGTLSVFKNRVFTEDGPQYVDNHTVAETNNDVAAIVNDDPSAIGFVGYAFQRGAKPLNLVNECGLESQPDPFASKTEEYALQRRLYLYNRGDQLDEQAQKFLEFALSENADGVVTKSGFINLGIKRQSQSMDSGRAKNLIKAQADNYEAGVIREMLAQMLEHDRLSTTFRFRTGSSKLDERGLLDMQRLISYLEGKPEGTEITLVGFTDDVGAFDANRDLSKVRAQQVAADLAAFANGKIDHVKINVDGFGEVAPAGCNTSEIGRGVNRRVEVWVSKDVQG